MIRVDWRQTGILSERYLELILADPGYTALLLLQAPVIASIITLEWGNLNQITPSLYYVLALSAIWFGTINATREIVKEKDIFCRERRVGLNPTAYVLSKLSVLALLGFVQCLCLVVWVNYSLALPGITLLHFVILFAASLAGTGMGLTLSALSDSANQAMSCIPLLLLPQILFSQMVLSHAHATRMIKLLDDLTITSWAHQGLVQVAAAEPDIWSLARSFLVLLIMAAFFIWVATLVVARRRN